MTWTPLAESGVPFEFESFADIGTVAMVGSVLTAIGAKALSSDPLVSLTISTALPVRMTVQSFTTNEDVFNGDIYVPANAFGQINQAAPYPSGNWTLPTGPQTSWSPTQFTPANIEYFGTRITGDSEPIPETFQILVEVDMPELPPDCDEPGQVTRCYVSTFDQPRIHESRLFQQGKRCLEANFNGAIGVGRKIVAVKWSMQTPYSVVMDTARITADQRSTRVNITAAWTGDAWMRAQVTLDNGEIYTQLFHVVVPPSPWFGDVSPTAGPSELTASAP